MSWIDDWDDEDDNFEPSQEELEAARKLAEAPAQTRAIGATPGRSNVDDILDTVSDTPKKKAVPKGHCPLCGTIAKVRGPRVGSGTRTLRCQNPKCRNEWPTGQRITREEVPPVPPRPGTFGPYTGEGGPPIDANQPLNRRLAEHIRRARDHEP
jgi:hypothetical protein